MASRDDAYTGYRYYMTIDDLDESIIQFKEVSGIESKTEVIEYQESGAIQQIVKKIPGRTTYSNIIAKRGITYNIDLWEWYKQVMDTDRDTDRKTATISVIDPLDDGNVVTYSLGEVWPCRFKGPDLDAQSDAIAFEEIEFVYETMDVLL